MILKQDQDVVNAMVWFFNLNNHEFYEIVNL
jgi:hypothetical protein